MDWDRLSEQVDAYCERTDFTFWAEPVNAVTNLAFLIAAALVLRWAERRGRLGDPAVWGLIGLVTAIGIGSFLFHTLATRWAGLADSLPILLFILAYLFVALSRFFGLARWQAGLATIGFLPAAAGIGWIVSILPWNPLGSSAGYLPAFLALAACGVGLALLGRPVARWLLAATGLFALSLTFRTLDLPLCETFPLGTHFLWHMLNGALLGLLVAAVVRHGARPGAEGGVESGLVAPSR